MNAKDLLKELRRVTFARCRVFNVKLFGNVRWGAYRELSADDVAAVICDFGMRQSVACESDVPEGEGVCLYCLQCRTLSLRLLDDLHVDSAAASVNAVVPVAARDKAKQRIAHNFNFVLI